MNLLPTLPLPARFFKSLLIAFLIPLLIACGGDDSSSNDGNPDPAPQPSSIQTPKNISLSVESASQITVSWSAVTDATKYEIYRGKNSDASDRSKISSLTPTSYADTGLNSNTPYYYWIKACNSQGTCSDFSQVSSAITLLNAPQNISLSVESASQITVSWSAVTDATKYEIYRGKNSDASDRSKISSLTPTSYADTGLNSNTPYYYWIKACNAQNDCSEFSSVESAKTQIELDAPKNIRSNINSTSQITVLWDTVIQADRYEIYRGTKSDASDRSEISSPTSSPYIDTGLNPNTTYYYWIKACNNNICSAFSSATSKTTKLATGTPQNINLDVNSTSQITILWDGIEDTKHYEIYRGTKSDASDRSEISSPTSGPYINTGLTPNTTYYYWIKACNAQGTCSDFSPASSATTLLNAPQNINLNVDSASQITVSWDNVTGTNRYEIYRGTNNNRSESNKISSPTSSPDIDTGLNSNTTYYYWIKVCNVQGTCSDFSPASSATTLLNAPQNISLNVDSASQITVSWSAVTGAKKYEIYRGKNSDASDRSEISSPTSGPYINTGLTPNTTYYYWIKACNAQGTCSDFSPASSATTLLNAPQNINLNVDSASQITVSWDNVTGTNRYEIYRGTNNNRSESNKISSTTSSPYIDTGLNSNTTYYYWIKACNAQGTCSDFSQVSSATTLLNAPQNISLSVDSTSQITVSWIAVTGATKYEIYRGKNSDASDRSKIFSSSLSSYADTGLEPKTLYYYWMKACQTGDACSDFSLPVTTRTFSLPPRWTQLPTSSDDFESRQDQTSLSFGNKLWVIGGSDRFLNGLLDVWSYTDGAFWIKESAPSSSRLSGRTRHTSVVHNGKMWVIGGYLDSNKFTNDVWNSTDGVTWTQVKCNDEDGFLARADHSSVVFNDGESTKMWVIGGFNSLASPSALKDVWSSTDGVTWTTATDSADFLARYDHTSVVHNGKMWVIGGKDKDGEAKNDVWSSTDGVTWTTATDSADFSVRYEHSSVVFDKRIWVIGGRKGRAHIGTNNNEVWNSTNGATWTTITATVKFTARFAHSSAVFNNRVWVIGGDDGASFDASNLKNDVWYYSND
jgi:fibronectin type 3 domain-containing protein/dihydrofolate reductase